MYRPKYLNPSNEEHIKPDAFAQFFAKQFSLYTQEPYTIISELDDFTLDGDFTLAELDSAIN
jgi:hypothetical protein